MDDFTNIFDPTDGQGATHEDQELAIAGELLVKFAEEEGVDLSKLSETELLGLVNTLRGDGTTEDINAEPLSNKEASHNMDENQINEVLFDALVTRETAKVAAAEGLDLAALGVEDVAELRLAIAEEIAADPDTYFAKSAAAEELQDKIAESDYLGRIMARSFADELGIDVEKIAKGEQSLPASGTPEFAKLPANMQQARTDYESRVARGAKKPGAVEHARHTRASTSPGFAKIDAQARAAEKARAAEATAARPVGAVRDKVKNYLSEHVARPIGRAALDTGRFMGVRNRSVAKGVGGAALGLGALGTAAAGYAGARHIARAGARDAQEKRSFDELALERAQEYLISQGIDPSTGEKVAASEAEIEDAINARAIELLEESGWLE